MRATVVEGARIHKQAQQAAGGAWVGVCWSRHFPFMHAGGRRREPLRLSPRSGANRSSLVHECRAETLEAETHEPSREE